MKIVIISDIHANFAALKALPERRYDELWCLGDLVNYGPNPHEVIRWVRANATAVVRGNHDHASGFSVEPLCSEAFRRLAEETLRYTLEVCTYKDLHYLKALPVYREIKVERTQFFLVHAMPTNPLFGYCFENSPDWREEVDCIEADVLLVGHTHTPFVRQVGKTTILNPGSLGQPKTGRPLACYAVWNDGEILLGQYEYAIEETVQGIRRMPILPEDQEALIGVLRTGEIPTHSRPASPSRCELSISIPMSEEDDCV